LVYESKAGGCENRCSAKDGRTNHRHRSRLLVLDEPMVTAWGNRRENRAISGLVMCVTKEAPL
jgi:hypothetical protein